MEPLIIEDGTDELELAFQSDHAGEEGDVRDILIVRRHLKWEIGLSLKHNHTAAKHPRLSATLDFGKKWYNIPCSEEYWKKIIPVFEYLKSEKEKGSLWRELPNKENDVYVPLLDAFKDELEDAIKSIKKGEYFQIYLAYPKNSEFTKQIPVFVDELKNKEYQIKAIPYSLRSIIKN